MEQPQKVVWEEQEFAEVRPGIAGATVHTPQLTVTMYRYAPGSRWEEHAHPQDQVTSVLSGTIDFRVGGEPVRLGAGETATIPGGTPHSATVPESGPAVVTLNVLTSRREPPPRG